MSAKCLTIEKIQLGIVINVLSVWYKITVIHAMLFLNLHFLHILSKNTQIKKNHEINPLGAEIMKLITAFEIFLKSLKTIIYSRQETASI